MAATADFLTLLTETVSRYRTEVAAPHEHLAILRWQIAQRHALDERTTMPGHVTTSAIVVSPDHRQVLLIDHIALRRWLQPGGHYEPADRFHRSAAREAAEETGITGLALHGWHRGADVPFNIDSHEVPGKAARGEQPHLHHDLQYLFLADPRLPLKAEPAEVHAAMWKPVCALRDVVPIAAARLERLAAAI